MLNQIGQDEIGRLVVYCSDQTHFSVQNASRIIGVNPENFRTIPTTKSTNFQLSPDSLHLAILSDIKAGLIPLYLCATVGTTASSASGGSIGASMCSGQRVQYMGPRGCCICGLRLCMS